MMKADGRHAGQGTVRDGSRAQSVEPVSALRGRWGTQAAVSFSRELEGSETVPPGFTHPTTSLAALPSKDEIRQMDATPSARLPVVGADPPPVYQLPV